MDIDAKWRPLANDGDAVQAGAALAEIAGEARDLLTAERLLLNLVGRLSGIATLTRQYVDAIAGTRARIYDTRKTTPGLRRLEKYAVRCGGGTNHRTGLFDAVLIKDNHLAFAAAAHVAATPREAVERARQFVAETASSLEASPDGKPAILIEVEVDTLDQLRDVLPALPDIVLLDNMPPDVLREAVALRDAAAPQVELEASGGISLHSVRAAAESGVERISVGGLTHSASSLDVGLDWKV
jgi:nicotinate-nucleotide pyrophosphorylase (carboxylating)